MMPEPIPSAIYARVSPTRHVKTETEKMLSTSEIKNITEKEMHQSLLEAISICEKDAEHEGNKIVAVYCDEYVSGKSVKQMIDFNHMLDDATNQKNTATKGGDGITSWKRIYCRRVNRFGRNRADMIQAELKLTELGVSLKFIENGIDTAKPFGKSIMAVLAEVAQMDLDEISANTKRGRDDVLIHGKPTKTGRPFGRPKKDINIKAIRQLRLLPINDRPTWKQISNDYKISVSVILQKLKAAGFWDEKKRCII